MNVEKPQLSFWQIWNMSFGFLGIQFGFALQNANVSRIFETMGASESQLPILWLAAPTTGLIIQPIIGYFSDRTWGSLGRRRPYFLVGAVLASLGLILMPQSSTLWMAAGLLWLLDASINVSMEPFRALVGDLLPSSQRTTGFAMQSFFIGIGAVIASALPYIFTNYLGISNVAAEGEVPDSVKWSFYLGAFAFASTVIWTVFRTKEYPPAEFARYAGEPETSTSNKGFIPEMLEAFRKMPLTMKQLAVVQFFSWFTLFAMWIYTTNAVTKHVYGATEVGSALYNEGANWVGVCFAVYNGFSAIFAFFIIYLANRTSRRAAHAISLLVGGLSFISIYFIKEPMLLLVPFVGIGLAWSSILAMPYAILSGSLPAHKMGVYMGIFNFFIVIPQITAASILGFMVKNFFGGEAIFALMAGGFSMLLAAGITMRVRDDDEKIKE